MYGVLICFSETRWEHSPSIKVTLFEPVSNIQNSFGLLNEKLNNDKLKRGKRCLWHFKQRTLTGEFLRHFYCINLFPVRFCAKLQPNTTRSDSLERPVRWHWVLLNYLNVQLGVFKVKIYGNFCCQRKYYEFIFGTWKFGNSISHISLLHPFKNTLLHPDSNPVSSEFNDNKNLTKH